LSYDWQVIVQFRRKLIVHLISKHSMNFSSNFIVCFFIFEFNLILFFFLISYINGRSFDIIRWWWRNQSRRSRQRRYQSKSHSSSFTRKSSISKFERFVFFVILFRSIEMYWLYNMLFTEWFIEFIRKTEQWNSRFRKQFHRFIQSTNHTDSL